MAILIDTNILLRSLYPEHPQYSAAESSVSALQLRNEPLYIAPQNLIEFWRWQPAPVLIMASV
jgi:predicted nucleic-acid-binding protein